VIVEHVEIGESGTVRIVIVVLMGLRFLVLIVKMKMMICGNKYIYIIKKRIKDE
jgi:hypothetical protein